MHRLPFGARIAAFLIVCFSANSAQAQTPVVTVTKITINGGTFDNITSPTT